MVSNKKTSKKNNKELTAFADPLITLLHSKNLNKDKELRDTLCEYIDEITDTEIKKWCIDSLTLLRDLEKIETQLDQWEFHTLDFTLEINTTNNKQGNSIRTNLANRVLEKSNILRNLLFDQKDQINLTINRSKKLSTNVKKIISDSGTILIELTLRIVKLSKLLDEKVTIGYSRAKLTIIGSELKKLVTLHPGIIDNEIILNYTKFVDNLLNQLNTAVEHNDTVGLWESVGIIGDVEKMFESMKQTTSMADKENENNDTNSSGNNESKVKEENNFNDSIDVESASLKESEIINNGLKTDKTLIDSEIEEENKDDIQDSKSLSNVSAKEIFSNDDDLIRTNISDHIPELMQAFNDDKIKKEVKIHQNKIDEKDKGNEKEIKVDENVKTGYFSYFKPSILNAFYQPQMKEPIYINKKELTDKEGIDKNKEAMKLTNTSIAIKLDQLSLEDRIKNELLEREKGLRNKESIMDSQLLKSNSTIQKQISTSPLLQQLTTNTSSVVSNALVPNKTLKKQIKK